MRKFQFVICVEAIIYLLLYNLHDCTFKQELRQQAAAVINYSVMFSKKRVKGTLMQI